MKTIRSAIVTGATGVVGQALLAELKRRQIPVFVVLHEGSRRNAAILPHPLLHTQPQSTTYDALFHLAWQGSAGAARQDAVLQQENVRRSAEAVQLARRLNCRVFVGTGSQAECGRLHSALTVSAGEHPENAYGRAKSEALYETRSLCASLGIRHIWARILSVYGPHDRAETLVMDSIRKFSRGISPEYTPGEQIWDFLYAQDAAEILYHLALQGDMGVCYPVGSGEARTLRSYIEEIHTVMKATVPLRMGALPYAAGQVMHLEADMTAVYEATGFRPAISFAEGIRRTAAWWQAQAADV
ncbi:MAG: NAD-dependent epimerase/dehydratase family protein [Lachnospiraceae bacterium]